MIDDRVLLEFYDIVDKQRVEPFAIVLNDNRKLEVLPILVHHSGDFHYAVSDNRYFVVYLPSLVFYGSDIANFNSNLTPKERYFIDQKFLTQDFDYIQDGDFRNADVPLIIIM